MSWIKKFRSRNKKTEQVIKKKEQDIPIELGIVNATHQTMALTLSEIARLYPKEFDMIKSILTEYSFLIESVLLYRDTGKVTDFFMKLQEFVIRSIKGYLTVYEETDEVVEEEVPVVKSILKGIAKIQEQIELYEGNIKLGSSEQKPLEVSKPKEDWSDKPQITVATGIPELNIPVTDIKGIGKVKAVKLAELGVTNLEEYVEYMKAQQEEEAEDEEEIEDNNE